MARHRDIEWVEDAPADAGVREQLIAAAGEHFRRFGFGKTTLAEVARDVGFSKAYVYRFFESKQQLGEAICSRCFAKVQEEVEAEIGNGGSATERLRRALKAMPRVGTRFAEEAPKLFEIAATASKDQWPAFLEHERRLHHMLLDLVSEGRRLGEFERKTPADEVVRAILLAMGAAADPGLRLRPGVPAADDVDAVIGLVLRSLAP